MTWTLPPEITAKKFIFDGYSGYEFRHRQWGELGRVVASDFNGKTKLTWILAGDPADPMTEKRKAILEPICKQLEVQFEKQTGHRAIKIQDPEFNPDRSGFPIQGQIVECLSCNKLVAHVILGDKATAPDIFEDYYRRMYGKMAELNLPTWIVGPERKLADKVTLDILQAWPVREEGPKTWLHEDFDRLIRVLQSSHCEVISLRTKGGLSFH